MNERDPPLVAVDAQPAARAVATGTERYTRELLRRLPAAAPGLRFVFYSARPGRESGLDLTVLPTWRLWSQVRLPLRLVHSRPAALFVPANPVPFLSPVRATTVVHDLAFERFPEAYPARQRRYLALTSRWAARRCPLLITVSYSTARDLEELYGVDPARIVVAHPGLTPPRPPTAAETDDRLARLEVYRPYALVVGRVEARKGQLEALKAVERTADLTLIVAGPVRDRERARTLAGSPRARVLGAVDQADLEALWAGAEVALVPSVYEGFGFTLLEAMARGVPVVAARAASLPEVGGEAALYVDDCREDLQFAQTISLARERAAELRRLGPERAAEFRWEAAAEKVAGALTRLIA